MNPNWPNHYILVGRTPIAVDLLTWADWFEKPDNRKIAKTEINDRCHVSTIFLGLDHNFSDRGDPVLFETLVFGGPLDGEMLRCCTYTEAERLHAETVAQARIACARVDAIKTASGAES
jgi:hypothetical protein